MYSYLDVHNLAITNASNIGAEGMPSGEAYTSQTHTPKERSYVTSPDGIL